KALIGKNILPLLFHVLFKEFFRLNASGEKTLSSNEKNPKGKSVKLHLNTSSRIYFFICAASFFLNVVFKDPKGCFLLTFFINSRTSSALSLLINSNTFHSSSTGFI